MENNQNQRKQDIPYGTQEEPAGEFEGTQNLNQTEGLEQTDALDDSSDLPTDGEEDLDGESCEDASEEAPEEDSCEEDAAATNGSEAQAGSSGSQKGFFKKNKKKDKKDEKIEELTDQVKRQMAEFDNFRKRTEKEKTQMYEIGAKSIIEKVLPVVDNFERGLAAVPEENKEDAFVDGMNKIYKQLMTMLEEADVKPIEAVGKEFDPNLHNAVMQTESEEYDSGIVAQELQKGYTYRDSVVRHSMVAVVS